jgi:hypothetical protein
MGRERVFYCEARHRSATMLGRFPFREHAFRNERNLYFGASHALSQYQRVRDFNGEEETLFVRSSQAKNCLSDCFKCVFVFVMKTETLGPDDHVTSCDFE